MVNNFIFVEDGSLKQEDLKKLFTVSGMSDANVIRYKQGATKPELVSVENDNRPSEVEIMNKTIETYRNVGFGALEKFIIGNTQREAFYNDILCRNQHKIIYRGSIEDFLDNFREFLTHEYTE